MAEKSSERNVSIAGDAVWFPTGTQLNVSLSTLWLPCKYRPCDWHVQIQTAKLWNI